MKDEYDKGRNKGSLMEKENNFKLEDIAKQKVTLDTDIMDFLTIAGWDTCGPIYRNASERAARELREHVNERRERLLSSEKHKESRFRNSILEGGYGKRFKTITELKNIIENGGMRIHNLHYKTLVYFNDTLKKYGIEPIKVGGKHTLGILRNLQKYGLEPN